MAIKQDTLEMQVMILKEDIYWTPLADKRDAHFHDHHWAGTKTHVHIKRMGEYVSQMPWTDEDRL